jgi:hypothetical protein
MFGRPTDVRRRENTSPRHEGISTIVAHLQQIPTLGTTEPRDRAAHNSRGGGRRIDHLPHLSDLRGRKATDLSVLSDDRLVLGEINAKSLIVSNIALDPLDVRTEPVQHLVRLRGIDDMALAAAYTENWMRRAASSRSLGDFRPGRGWAVGKCGEASGRGSDGGLRVASPRLCAPRPRPAGSLNSVPSPAWRDPGVV